MAARNRRRARFRLTDPVAPGTAEGNPRHGRITLKCADSHGAGACLASGIPHRRNPASPGKAMPPVHRVGAGVRRLRPFRRRALST